MKASNTRRHRACTSKTLRATFSAEQSVLATSYQGGIMPETKLLLPKFLTKETAEEAILVAAKTVLTPPISLDIKRQDFHIVVLVPKMVVEAGNYPNYPINHICWLNTAKATKNCGLAIMPTLHNARQSTLVRPCRWWYRYETTSVVPR